MTPIVVNGKFLNAGLEGGVHRTALLFTRELVRHANESGVPIRVAAPAPIPDDVDLGEVDAQVVPGRVGGGQPWEMTTLPWAARDALLVSLCNLGPVLHRNAAVMIHDVQPRLFPTDYPARQRIGFRMVQDALGVTARQILTVSQFSKAMLLAHGVGTDDKIAVVPNGCDHLVAVDPDETVLDRYPLDRDGYVLALGSLQAYKNLDVLFRAMPEPIAGRYRLVVAGSPTERHYREQGWHPPDHVVFTGRVSDAELRALYQGARAVAVPSLTEGFGLPPLEAMSCGAPVVAARAGAIPEVCGDAAVLVQPRSVDAWVAGLTEVCTDESLRTARRSAAQQRVNSYSWTAAGEQLWGALEPLLDVDLRKRTMSVVDALPSPTTNLWRNP